MKEKKGAKVIVKLEGRDKRLILEVLRLLEDTYPLAITSGVMPSNRGDGTYHAFATILGGEER